MTAKNKPKLPLNSYPRLYKLGETKLQIKFRVDQHFKTLQTGKWDSSGLSSHARNCHKNIDWYKNNTLSIKNKYFDRKVRESLEIRYSNTHHEGMNLDDGNYVTTQQTFGNRCSNIYVILRNPNIADVNTALQIF